MFRLFVGIALPEPVRDRLAGLAGGLPGARWVDADNLHVTLRFIGEVGRDGADDIHHALARIRAPAFELGLSGVGCFGSGRKVRALWAGIGRDARLAHLQEKVESAVVRAGFAAERRKFTPHVTLARFKGGTDGARIGAFLERNGDLAESPFPVRAFTLFRSHLGREGAHYEALVEYELDA